MNFPGLEPAWNTWQRTRRLLGIAPTWSLKQCREALADPQTGVIVVASTALGDTVLCTPLLDLLSRELGPERVTFLVREPYLPLYEEDPRLQRAFSVRGKFRGLMEISDHLEVLKPSAKIALVANASEPDLIPWLQCCGVRGFLRYPTRWSHWTSWFANRDAMRPPEDPLYATGHAIDNTLAMGEALGLPTLPPEERRLSLHVGPDAREKVSHPQRKRLVIHPGASREDKQWPLERWAKVAKQLSEEFDLEVALTGSGGEKELAEELRGLISPNVLNLAGELDLPELAAFLQQSRLFLSGDTGPYHIAVATGCRTVTLFAPRDRGSSTEACGLHHADRSRHAELETEGFGRPTSDIPEEAVLHAARRVLRGEATA